MGGLLQGSIPPFLAKNEKVSKVQTSVQGLGSLWCRVLKIFFLLGLRRVQLHLQDLGSVQGTVSA